MGELDYFVELCEPVNGAWGWYVFYHDEIVSDHSNDYYLHDDGLVKPYCYEETFSDTTGWFSIKADMEKAVEMYYNKWGKENSLNKESQVMRFE